MKKYLGGFLILALLSIPLYLWASGSNQTINTVPTNNSQFQTNLQNFLKHEDADRYELLFNGMVVSGGTHSTVAALTAAPTALVAFPGGHYTTEVASITYANNETTWVIAHKDLTGNLSNFARVAGTHYLIDSTSASKPSLPADSVWLMEVTTSGGSITAVVDLRTRVPVVGTYLLAELPAAGSRGRLALVRDISSGTLYLDNGTTWVQTISSNPMTAAGDMIVGGTSGIPTRLAKGTANQVLGMNNADTTQEYKTLTAGSGISIVHTANAVTFAQSAVSPAGSVQMYIGTSAPSGWLLCDAAIYDADTYPDLFDAYIANASVWGLGTATGTFTVNTGTDTVTLTAHGLANGSRVHVSSSVTLPAGLSANTRYFIINATTDTFQLSTAAGGAILDITSAGTGTHTLYNSLQTPNFNARMPVGIGAASHDFTISSIDTGTEQLTIESNTALYTGDVVLYDTTAGAATGLTDATNYYVIRVSATIVKLATTEALALAGTPIDLTGTGSGVQVLRQTLTTHTVGTIGGTENVTGGSHGHALTDPGHAHTQRYHTAGGTGPSVQFSVRDSGIANTNATTTTDTTGMTVTNTNTLGIGSNMNPFLAITFIIKT